MKGIYAIYDTKTEDILGPPTLFAHAAAAVRWFGDVATLPESQVGKHIEDYQLIRLGWFHPGRCNDEFITAEYDLILEGSTWAAAQQDRAEPPNTPAFSAVRGQT